MRNVGMLLLAFSLGIGGGHAQAAAADAATTAPAAVVVKLADLEYARVGERPLLLDIYRPEGDGPFPAVAYFHGGGWRAGSKTGGIQRIVDWLVPHGFAVVGVDYRLSTEAKFPAQIHDCKAAVRWLRAHAAEQRIDPARIGVWGSSAGGHLAALMGVSGGVEELEGDLGNNDQSSRVAAALDWWGPTDLVAMDVWHKHGPKSMEAVLLGTLPRDNPELARLASPLTHVTPDDPPILIMHGTRDKTVPVEQSLEFEKKLKAAGVDVELFLYEGGHTGEGISLTDVGVDRMAIEFFSRHLKGERGTGPVVRK